MSLLSTKISHHSNPMWKVGRRYDVDAHNSLMRQYASSHNYYINRDHHNVRNDRIITLFALDVGVCVIIHARRVYSFTADNGNNRSGYQSNPGKESAIIMRKQIHCPVSQFIFPSII